MRTNPKIAKGKNGKYEIRWSECLDGTWRSRRKMTGTENYEEAVQKLSDFLSLKPAENKDLTVNQAFDLYLRYHSAPKRSERTDRQNMRAPLGVFGAWPASTIKSWDIESYTNKRLKSVKPATVRRELTALQAVLNYAVKREMISRNRPYAFQKPADSAPRDRWITEEQQEDILRRLPEADLDVRIFLRLALTYGVRKGAIEDLRFGEQIDFISGTINFNVPNRKVTRKRRPTVPMTKTIRSDLSEMFQKKGRGSLVIDKWTTVKRFNDFMESIGYGWVTPHVLKHSAITLMLRAGVDPGDVSKLTATDLRTIYRVYRHHSHSELLDLAEGRGI